MRTVKNGTVQKKRVLTEEDIRKIECSCIPRRRMSSGFYDPFNKAVSFGPYIDDCGSEFISSLRFFPENEKAKKLEDSKKRLKELNAEIAQLEKEIKQLEEK